MANLSALTPERIWTGAQNDDLDAALRDLQAAAGIRHGDVAGAYFSFLDSEHSQWVEAPTSQRSDWLRGWLAREQADAQRPPQ
ncbi:hypothetical protein ACU4GI_32715 [Cupriavidus basilensis]